MDIVEKAKLICRRPTYTLDVMEVVSFALAEQFAEQYALSLNAALQMLGVHCKSLLKNSLVTWPLLIFFSKMEKCFVFFFLYLALRSTKT